MSILDSARRILFVHAHPDDETLSTGALIAHCHSHGIACDLVTATRGEQGEVVDGPLAHLEGSPDLAAHREGELAGAIGVLGIDRHAYLGISPARAAGLEPRTYTDSGMQWVTPTVAGPADSSDRASLVSGTHEEETADLAAAVRAFQPDLLVSYDAHGGYGHPDHVRVHDLTASVGRSLDIPVAEVRLEPGEGVQWLDLSAELPVVARALEHHATQLSVEPDGGHIVMSGGQRQEIRTSIGLIRTV